MHAIVEQLQYELKRFAPPKQSIVSLFIGGGTPSTIKASLYEPFFALLTPYLAENAEITTEANPQSATKEWLSGMKALGINRVSFGVQSFNDAKLKFLGRAHTKESALSAIHEAYTLGIKNISLDLIYGTSLDTMALLEEDLHIASSLPINHLSAYALTLEENTPFFKRTDVVNTSEKLAKDFVTHIIQAGFAQYEISNFGSYQSVHNKGYWEHQNYLGIGSGAVGFLENKRFYPAKEIETYINNPLEHNVELLSHNDLHVEKIFLGARSNIGIALSLFNTQEKEKVSLLIEEKKLLCKDTRVYNPDYFLSDEIALFIVD
jgi:oxygen-independent coproporphyrinogen-3 oxidase